MKYVKWKCRNYKAFYGEAELDFNIEDKSKNIVLIRGCNGFGKTSIITGIKLGLYGEDAGINKMITYKQYLRECINDKALHEGERTSWVEIDFINEEVINGDKNRTVITVRREWTLVTTDDIKECFYIFENGEEVELDDDEQKKRDYLDKIIPKEVLNFFVFDAEEIRYTADDFNSSDSLTMDIAKILGLTVIDKAKEYLECYIDKQKDSNDNSLDSKLIEHNLKLKRLEEEINEYEERQKIVTNEKEKIQNEYDKKTEWLKEHGYNDLTSRASCEFKIKELESKKDNILNSNEDMNQEDFAYLLLGPELGILTNQLHEEAVYVRQENIKDNKEEIKERLLLRIKNISTQPKLTKRQMKDIGSEIEGELKTIFNASSEHINLLHYQSLTKDEFDKLQLDVTRISDSFKEKLIWFKIKTEELEEIEHSIEREKHKLNRLPNASQVEEIGQEIKLMQSKLMQSKLMEYEEEAVQLMSGLEELRQKKNNEQKQISRFSEQAKEKNKRLDKIQLCERVLSLLTEYTLLIKRRKAAEIIDSLSSMFSRLSHKKDMIKEFKIDSNTFEITMWDKYGNKLAKRRLSEGEKQIYGLSLTFALAKASDKEFAFIIDTPFAKLDSEHKDNVIKEFIPNVGEQVIILAHDEEVNEERYRQLEEHIGKEYRIFESKDNISFVKEQIK